MAYTVSDVQTNLAYRLGETAAPTSTVATQRLEWINMAYFTIARRKKWWWLEATSTSNTSTGSTTGYAEPTDLKEFIELKIGTIYYTQIPYGHHEVYDGYPAVVTLPTLKRHYKYYRFGGYYFPIPQPTNDSATHTIKYYKRVTKRTANSDTFLIPDEYIELLTSFAEGRYWMSITQQVKAQAPMQEFEQILSEMTAEHNRRGESSSGWVTLDPEDITV